MKCNSDWIVAGLICLGVAGCTSGQAGTIPNIASPNIAATSTLQFAVGTATIGIANGASTQGLNVVATFRQANGNNATGVNTPTLSGPAALKFDPLLGGSNVVAGVTPAQLGALANQAASQASPTTPFPLSSTIAHGFGPFVGVFGYGLAADNLISNADLVKAFPTGGGNPPCYGVATSYISNAYYGQYLNIGVIPNSLNSPKLPGDLVRSAELALPIPSGSTGGIGSNPQDAPLCTCPSTCATNLTTLFDPTFPVQYFGGPPAWPTPQGYGGFSYFVGYPLGFSDFSATPVAGTYSLAVAFSTSSDYSTFGTITKTAQLPASAVGAPLPLFTQPKLTVNADGSGVVTVTVPARVHEAVITIVTTDCDLAGRDLGANGVYVNHYALVTKATGPQTLFLSSALGPPSTVTGLPTHTFCTVSDLQALNAVSASVGQSQQPRFQVTSIISAVGFDYPAYESSYPFNLTAAPPITTGDGHTGQADITTTYPLTVTTNIVLSSES